METEGSLRHSQVPATCPYPEPAQVQVWGFSCKCYIAGYVYGEELLAPRPTSKLEDHPLLAVCDCLFSIFTATLNIAAC